MNAPESVRFVEWHRENQEGGWRCLWRRRAVWHAQLMQKMGLQVEVTAPLFWGKRMQVVTGEVISSSILAFGYAEPTITALMLAVLQRGQTFVDAGTHFGYEAMLASELVGPKGRVICFEPHSQAFEIARRNLAEFPQTTIHREALGDHHGELYLEELPLAKSAFSPIRRAPSLSTVAVPATTLDFACSHLTPNGTVDFVKCDVEGFEVPVVRGARRLLTNDRPVLVLEADMPSSDGQLSSRAFELAQFLTDYDYCGMNFDFDGTLKTGPLNSFPVFHANVAFIPRNRTDLLAQFGLV